MDSVVPLIPSVHKKPKFVTYDQLHNYYDDYYSSSDSEDEDYDGPKIDIIKRARKVKTLTDLITLTDLPLSACQACNKDDLRRLKKIRHPLELLNSMVGMEQLKNTIIYQVLYYCQNLHQIARQRQSDFDDDHGDLMHTVIYGKPGSGKTSCARIIGKIYLKLGVLSSDKFVIAKRKDLIGQYLGQTAPKTTKMLKSATGGVLFIDEAYALGNKQGKDIYSKECIDTINQYLTEHKHEIAVIIAGYRKDMQECFFSFNQGLERRFPWVYEIEDYNHQQLQQIFIKQTTDSGWSFDGSIEQIIPAEIFKRNSYYNSSNPFDHDDDNYFKYGGGDTEIFLTKCKLAHSLNTFGLPEVKKCKFTKKDINKGLELHILHKKKKQDPNQIPKETWAHIYT